MPECGLHKGRLARLIEAIRFGMSLSGACGLCRISQGQLRQAAEACPELAELLAEAEGQAEMRLLGLAMKAAEEDGNGAVKLLERRFTQWGKEGTVRHEHTHRANPELVAALVAGRAQADRQLAAPAKVIDIEAKPVPDSQD